MSVNQRFIFGLLLLVVAGILFSLNTTGGLILLAIVCTVLGLICVLLTIFASQEKGD